MVLLASGGFSVLEKKSYDSRAKYASGKTNVSDRIALVLLDKESLTWAQEVHGWSWPWPREAYAKLTKYFNRANASSLAFDMIYSEPSLYGKEDDKSFAKASSDFG